MASEATKMAVRVNMHISHGYEGNSGQCVKFSQDTIAELINILRTKGKEFEDVIYGCSLVFDGEESFVAIMLYGGVVFVRRLNADRVWRLHLVERSELK